MSGGEVEGAIGGELDDGGGGGVGSCAWCVGDGARGLDEDGGGLNGGGGDWPLASYTGGIVRLDGGGGVLVPG